jgi:broad specificity phosphatase PhoE
MTESPVRPAGTPRRALLLPFLLLFLTGGLGSPAPVQAQEDVTVVFLVRHAEKVDDSRDPELSDEGRLRAAALAEVLEYSGIDRVLSTDYIRTRDTAAPVAKALGLTVELYDPRDLSGAADGLLAQGGRVLVVGHSNTTPDLVQALGGDPGPTLEDSDYDRLYMVTIHPDGTSTTVLIRFGVPTKS